MKIYRILGKRGRITIPYEIRMNMKCGYNDVLSFEEQEDGSVTVRREKVCDCCGMNSSEPAETVTLLDFLNDLTEAEKKAALVHLSLSVTQNAKVLQ